MRSAKNLKDILTFFLILLISVSLVTFSQSKTSAVTGSEWRAGNIIDDVLFYDNTTMSINDIQSFLNSKVGTCDTNGTQPASEYGRPDLTHAQYAASQGWPAPPYICLKDYYQVPVSDQIINNFGTNIRPDGSISATQIIKNAADSYNISPKVLLATLQKESPGPLITDSWPLASQYRNAMGYGCPDTAPCDPQYEGFYNQMTNAARQFKLYKDNPNNYRYKPFQDNAILFNPNQGCGSATVSVQNYATAGLYNYTPYQPNTAALNNLYGFGDSCSAYGNRNFWRIYNDWFGSTIAPQYDWQPTSLYAYTDDSKTTATGLNSLKPGQRVFVGFTAKNTGNVTWTNTGPNPFRVGTTHSLDRASAFYDSTWISPSRPALMKEASVAPGQTATFEFWMKAPIALSAGSFSEYFNVLSEGKAWMPDKGLYLGGTVESAKYTWQPTSLYAYTDDSKTTATGLNSLKPGQRVFVGFTAKNTGNVTWTNTGPNPFRVGTTHSLDRASAFYDSTWISPSRPALMKEASVAPGQTATFEFWMKAPIIQFGNFTEYFNVLSEGFAWTNDIGLNLTVSSQKPNFSWSLASQYAYSDDTKTTPIGLNLSPNQSVYIGFTAKNTGNVVWYNSGSNPIDVGTTNPYDNASPFCSSGWLGCNRPARMKEASVAPGQTATFEFWAKAPANSGAYTSHFNLVSEGATWMNDIGLSYLINVK